ncbi:MAG: Hsp70 family protein [Clostridium sp.]|nr:Hsp70 family protein [Clostridium sp.]MCI7443250.1 Hsp70 family protein [Clostridium sp.]
MAREKGNIIGIDLGTTNTVVAKGQKNIYGFGANTIEIPQRDETGNNVVFSKSFPSVVYKRKGEDILESGIFAKAQKINQPLRTIYNTKRYMGLEHIWKIDDMSFKARDVAGEILRVCKIQSEKSFANRRIDGVTISVPASFTNDQIRDTRYAAQKAGFSAEEIKIVTEPTAALISYINELSLQLEEDREIDFSKSKRILVFDIGGGTCDVCIIDVEQNGINISLKEQGVGRYEELGGIDFDERAAEYLFNKYLNEKSINPEKMSKEERAIIENKLVAFCERAKEKFSRDIELFGDVIDDKKLKYEYIFEKFYEDKDEKFSITKEEFDKATISLYYRPKRKIKDSTELARYKNIEDPIIKTLKDYDIDPKSIDYVFLTGGMSQYKNIKERVAEIMEIGEKNIIMAPNPMEACAIGAAIYHYYSIDIDKVKEKTISDDSYEDEEIEYEENNSTTIIDNPITSEAIMIDLVKGLPRVVIPKGKSVPCEGKIVEKFRTSSPSGIKINIYAGDNEFDSKMRIQRAWRGSFDPPIRIGTPVDIYYKIDKFKDLTFKIVVNDGIDNQEFELSSETDIKFTND